MSVTRGATTSSISTSSTSTTLDLDHTVDVGTTLLQVTITMEAGEAVSGTPQWSLGGGENLTVVHATTESGNNSDMRVYTYGLVNPTSGTGVIDFAFSSTDNVFISAINYIGTETASVAAATNFLSEDVNNAVTSTNVHASAGSSGNALYFAGCIKRGDNLPVSNNASFNELFEGITGSGNADHGYYIADLLDGAPSAITVTWSDTDENAGHYIEIVAAAGGINYERTLTSSVDAVDQQQAYELKFRQLLSALELDDSLIRTIIEVGQIYERLLSSSLDTTDALLVEALHNRQLVDNTELYDSITRTVLISLFRRLTSSIDINDSVSEEALLFRLVLSAIDLGPLPGVNDWIFVEQLANRLLTSPSVEVIDSILAFVGKEIVRVFAENISVTDSLVIGVLATRGLIDTITALDSLVIGKELYRKLDDNTDLTDLITRLVTGGEVEYVRLFAESIDTTDALIVQEDVYRKLDDNVDLTDLIVRLITGGAVNYERTLTDTVSLTDLLPVSASKFRALTETLSVADQLLAQRELNRLLVNIAVITDSIIRSTFTGPIEYQRVLTDNVELFDSIVRSILLAPQTYNRLLLDNVVLDDAIIRAIITEVTEKIFIRMLLERDQNIIMGVFKVERIHKLIN